MNTITSILLGIVQGLTEFLPISSSGHLVLFQNLFGLKEPELLFDAALHAGTLLAVCVYFRGDLQQIISETWHFSAGLLKGHKRPRDIKESPYALFALGVVIGTCPTAIVGIVFRDTFENLFASVTLVGVMLGVTGLILALTRLTSPEYTDRKEVGLLTALAVGLSQGLAIIPGISRSGATIVCGMLFKLERNLAARFSFLLSIPAILGALVLQLKSEGLHQVGPLPLFTGFATSALVGLLALKILMGMVRKGNLSYFAPYCWALGLFVIALKVFNSP